MATPTIRQEIAGTSTTVTSLTNTATFSSAALAGNQLVYLIAGDKNTGTLSVTDNTGSGTWTVEVSLPSTSVSLYVARKVAVGGETTITGTTTAAPATGNTGYALELDQAGTGAWGVVAKATNITTEATVSSMSTGTTGAATFEGLAIAAMAVDSATNVTSGSWSNGYTARYDAPTTSGTGGGAGGIHVASAAVAQGATTTSTWTNTTGTADQQSAAVVVFGRAASVSVVGTGASALALSTTTIGQKAATATGSSVLGLATTRTGSSTRTSTAGSTLSVATTSVASSSRSGTGLSALGITTTGQSVKDTVSLPAGGPLFFNFYVVEADGTYSAALPDYRSASIEPVFGEDGSVTIDYPVDGLNYELLRDGVTDELDLELAVWVGGRSDKSMRVLLTESDADLVAETGIHRFGGAFLNVLMSDMVVLPNPANEKQETVFTSATAGAIMTNLITTAKSAGYLASIGSATFNGSHDSNGVAWSNVVNTKFSPGRGYHDVLGDLVKFGLCEWEVGPDRELRLYQFGTLGTDRTVGSSPIILRWGRHLVSAPRKTSVRTAGTDVLAAGKEGLYQTAFSESARTRRGRRILRYVTANGIEDAGSLTAYAQAQLQVVTAGQLEQSHGLSFGKDDPLPIADYGIGDWIGSDTGDPDVAFVKRRVRQWRFAEDENGEITGAVVVGTLLQDTQAALAARIAAIEGGATVVGTSTATPADDTVAPAAPTGLVADSLAYQEDVTGDTYASVTLGWAEVTTNVDGSAATDVEGYRIRYKPANIPFVDPNGNPLGNDDAWSVLAFTPRTSPYTFSGVAPDTDIDIQVAAFDRAGNQGPWSTNLIHHTAVDNTPPPAPSAPVVSDWFGTLQVQWNGLDLNGAEMLAAAVDFDHVEVHVSQANNFTPDATTLTARIAGAGTWNVTDLPIGVTHYARLVAVDKIGNASTPSAVGSAIPRGIQYPDMGPQAIDSAQMRNAAILTAHIGDAQIVDAKVNTLSVGKVTAGTLSAAVTLSGIIRTATTGARSEMDSAGIRLYNAAGTATVNLNAATGAATITGEYRTGFTGTRMVFNAAGGQPDEIWFYPSSGSAYAVLSAHNHLGQVTQGAINMRGNSVRGDGWTGHVGAYPPEAYVKWGALQGVSVSALSCAQSTATLWGPTVALEADARNPNDGGGQRIEFRHRSSAGGIRGGSVLHYRESPSGEAVLHNPGADLAIFYSFNSTTGLYIGNLAGNPANLTCAVARQVSSRKAKKNERTMQFGSRTALGVVNAVEGKAWNYDWENTTGKPRTRKFKTRELRRGPDGIVETDSEGQPITVEVESEAPAEDPAGPHFFPIAEDMQAVAPELVTVADNVPGGLLVDVRDYVGVLWQALRELNAKVDTLSGPGRIVK